MILTYIDWLMLGLIAILGVFVCKELFFTKVFMYTYGFTFTDKDGKKAYSEVQTMSITSPMDTSFFRLAQQSVVKNGFPGYVYNSDPNFHLSYAMYLNSCWRRTSVLEKQAANKKDEREESTIDESADRTEAS